MPWGDYGDMLFEGLLNPMDEDYNLVDVHKIERTAPYIPKIYCANSTNIVVSEEVRELLQLNTITGIEKYHNTEIIKLVNIDWQSWDLNSDDPKFYPESGEPIDYIEDGENDPNLYNQLSEFYSIKITRDYSLKSTGQNYYDLAVIGKPIIDIFSPNNMNFILVSERFKNVIELENIDTLKFIEIQTSK
jgi:hypothetical protein